MPGANWEIDFDNLSEEEREQLGMIQQKKVYEFEDKIGKLNSNVLDLIRELNEKRARLEE